MENRRFVKLSQSKAGIVVAFLFTTLLGATILSSTSLAGDNGKKVVKFDLSENIYLWKFDRVGSPVLDLADIGYPDEAGPPFPGSEGPPWQGGSRQHSRQGLLPR